jgi:menaquinone-dependent protoporphyrinogen oxidase
VSDPKDAGFAGTRLANAVFAGECVDPDGARLAPPGCMSAILVLFASHYGQTRAIAERVSERLRTRGHEVDVADVRRVAEPNPSPEDYDVVVLGSRIEIGRHDAELRRYIRTHRDTLSKTPTAFFSVSMAAARADAGPDPDGYMDTLFTDLEWRPTCAVSFAGALPYRKYNWLTRFIMKRISRSAGHTTDTSKNHEFTDWKCVDAFADEITSLLPMNEQQMRSM